MIEVCRPTLLRGAENVTGLFLMMMMALVWFSSLNIFIAAAFLVRCRSLVDLNPGLPRWSASATNIISINAIVTLVFSMCV